MRSGGELPALIESVYQQCLEEGGWEEAHYSICRHIGAVGGVVIDVDSETLTPSKVLSVGLPKVEREFSDDGIHEISPPTQYALACKFAHTICDYDVMEEREIERHAFYDWLQNRVGVKYFIGSRLNGIGPVVSLAAVHFPAKHGPASDEQIRRFAHLRPHILNAWRVAKLQEQARSNSLFATMVSDLLPWGIIGLDRNGRCIGLNGKSHAIVNQQDGLSLDGAGHLRLAFAAVDRTLQGKLGLALRAHLGEVQFAGAALGVPRPSRRLNYSLQIIPWVDSRKSLDPCAPAVLIVIVDPSEPILFNPDHVRSLFGLTKRESDVLAQLLRGRSLPAAARRLAISHNTARVHLAAVLQKTGTKSQVELINKVRQLFPQS